MTNRLALAQTLVSGTVTLQGIPYSITASASGTAMGSNVSEAKKSATVASNSAAVTAARASIDKILADNSAILSDLEITSLISNNFTTTVRVFKPLGLEKIATTTDGINYFTNKETTIQSDQWLTVPNGKTLTFNAPGKNSGYLQIGDGTTSGNATVNSNAPYSNDTFVYVYPGALLNINFPFTNEIYAAILSDGTVNINNGGYVYNGGTASSVQSYDTLKIDSNSHIQNSGDSSYVIALNSVTNYGSIYCSPGYESYVALSYDNKTQKFLLVGNMPQGSCPVVAVVT